MSAKKKTAKKKITKKKAAKKKIVKKKTAKIYPKYHINNKEWDKLEVMQAIFDKTINSSLGLAYVCKGDSELPDVGTVFRWMNEEDLADGDKPICDMYARAKDIQVDFMADEIIDICDNQAGQTVMIDDTPVIIDGKPLKVIDSAGVAHAKLRSDNRKWIASKLKHRKYGDKLEVSGDPERPLAKVSNEDLDLQITILQKKLNGS